MFLITQLVCPPVFQAVETPCTCMHTMSGYRPVAAQWLQSMKAPCSRNGAGLQHAHNHVAANSLSDSSTVAAVVSATCPAPNCTYSCVVYIIRAQIKSGELTGQMYTRTHALPIRRNNQKAKMQFVKALIVDVMHLATWSVCTGCTDAGGTVHSKECPLLFAILIYLLTSGLTSLLAV